LKWLGPNIEPSNIFSPHKYCAAFFMVLSVNTSGLSPLCLLTLFEYYCPGFCAFIFPWNLCSSNPPDDVVCLPLLLQPRIQTLFNPLDQPFLSPLIAYTR